jgi:hypothetical protein
MLTASRGGINADSTNARSGTALEVFETHRTKI